MRRTIFCQSQQPLVQPNHADRIAFAGTEHITTQLASLYRGEDVGIEQQRLKRR
jgi:hypothetical protein